MNKLINTFHWANEQNKGTTNEEQSNNKDFKQSLKTSSNNATLQLMINFPVVF